MTPHQENNQDNFVVIDNSQRGQLKSLLGSMNCDIAKSWVDDLYDSAFLAGQRSMIEEIKENIKKMSTPAIARNEEIECCNCGEDLALESYDWYSEGYEDSVEDVEEILNKSRPDQECSPLERNPPQASNEKEKN